MKTMRFAFLSLLLPMLLVACGQREDVAPPAAGPASAAERATDGNAGPDAAPRTDAEAEAPAGQDAQAAAPQPPQGPPPVAGTHYVEIPDGQPYLALDGRIEVVEVFGYTCPACAAFEPLISAWKQRQPADVRVTPVAAPFGGFWTPYAKAYYTADSMGLAERTHRQMFEAIHLERSLPVQGVSNDQIAAFYARHGGDARQFASTMDSFAIAGRLRRAEQFVGRTGVDATPTMVVNGRYRVIGGQEFEEVLRIVDHLVARERAAGQE